ncbi:hypothetical protein [Actinoallomurus soli]|uniref:hypothetical protein n=1 Tax=Actinoallomurus soli TaxID=2952535 RepID=UPI00209397B8|nr:hypothetical protein [Actinoallomurus soli]MCO5973755.1 hypothetical protein [Actinoallomurus soli]
MLHADQPATFHIELWPPGSKQAKTKKIRFQFWAPREGDEVDVWTCRCDRPVGESTGAPGHWERTIPVVWERPKTRKLGL